MTINYAELAGTIAHKFRLSLVYDENCIALLDADSPYFLMLDDAGENGIVSAQIFVDMYNGLIDDVLKDYATRVKHGVVTRDINICTPLFDDMPDDFAESILSKNVDYFKLVEIESVFQTPVSQKIMPFDTHETLKNLFAGKDVPEETDLAKLALHIAKIKADEMANEMIADSKLTKKELIEKRYGR